MKKHLLVLGSALFFGLFLSSCDTELKDNIIDETEDYVDEVIFRMEESGNLGRFGCYELVFPISIVFSDSTTVEVNDYEELKDAIQDWKNNNDVTPADRPHFVFPIEVLNEDGEIITVEDKAALKVLAKDCRKAWFVKKKIKKHRHRCGLCFKFVFPVEIELPDGTIKEANSYKKIIHIVRNWKKNNPDSTDRPHLVFPIEVEMKEDGSIVTVNSPEELKDLRETCGEE